MKKMLTFCEKCRNVMMLKERKGRDQGNYECRMCGLTKKMKLERIEIKEKIFEEPITGLISKKLELPLEL